MVFSSHPENFQLTQPQADLDSKEDRNSVGEIPISNEKLELLKSKVQTWLQPGQPGHGILTSTSKPLRLCLFDGFLLYSPSMRSIQSQMDIKLFLRVSYAKAKARREARSGYVTLEGFWEDPPGYVEKIVWPNYVEDHKWMFEGGNVEGALKPEVLKEWNIKCQHGGTDIDLTTTLEWAVQILMQELPALAGST